MQVSFTWLGLLLVAACASAPAPCRVNDSSSARVMAAPSEAAIKARAHALLDAYDRMDEAAFVAELGSTFALFEGRELLDRETLLGRMRARRERGAPPRTRDWHSEQVRLSPEAAVFIGEAVEHIPADTQRPAGAYAGVSTLVFAPENAVFKAVHWEWEPSGLEGDRQMWNHEYATGQSIDAQPNQLLVDATRGLRPGRALDVGAGQGRNALFLASRGWKVTGVDLSDVGLRIARKQAEQRKLKLELVEADLTTWDFGRARWDLVTLIYMGRDPETIRKAQQSLKRGGLFVHEGFSPTPGMQVPDTSSLADLEALFAQDFTILRSEVVDGVSDWGKRQSKLVRFVARKH